MNAEKRRLSITTQSTRFQKHRVLILVGVNAACLVLVAVLFEIGLRLFAPGWLSIIMEYQKTGGAVDDVGTDRGWKVVHEGGRFVKFEPDSTFDMVHTEFRTKAHIDEWGGRRLTNTSTAETFLPFLGDSFTFGIGAPDEGVFVNLLQEHFDERLLNLGVPGSSLPDQRFIVSTRHGELGQPAVYHIVVFLGNELTDMIRFHERTNRAATPTANHPSKASQHKSLTWRMNAWLHESWVRHLYSVQYLKSKTLGAMNRRSGRRNMEPVFRAMDPEDKTFTTVAEKILAAELHEWETMQDTFNIRFVFILVPDRYQVVEHQRIARAKYYQIDPSTLDPDLPNRLVVSALEERGFPVIDTTEMFGALDNPETAYYTHDNHLNSDGHKLLAGEIAERLALDE